ncbi:hypothetical protein FOMPIDRAFT_57592 [Fomitopsis schrenkii]|uniref:Protein kinase domain-containing protein n=1 Tax=Fomitopsis schrenkii TaxID=2126942 RepID=S8E9W6_FOMSC|nr:hypothetical protein FOMPIDRAFT_57592 [Fomitopsis schrenkii]
MFSTLTLTGALFPDPITLPRHESFPARQTDFTVGMRRERPDWSARQVPQNGHHLTLEVGERIGCGRTGFVHAVQVTSIKPGQLEGDNSISVQPTSTNRLELCIKIAHLSRCRSLAREAWTYEQLPEGTFQGVITPRCYGFFTTRIPSEGSPPLVWSQDECAICSDEWPDRCKGAQTAIVDPTHDDPLPDEMSTRVDPSESPGGRELSPWLAWRPNPAAPLLSVLVMARGGRAYNYKDDCDEATGRRRSQEIDLILDDLSSARILHQDLRMPNVIRAPPDTETCPTHHHVHQWNIVDLSRANVDVKDDNEARHDFITELQRTLYKDDYFRVGFPEDM